MEHGGTAARIGFCCIVAGGGAALSVAACTDGPGVEQIDLASLSQALCEKVLECGCSTLQSELGITPPSCSTWNLEQLFGEGGGYDEYGGDGYEGEYGGGNDDTAGGEITHTFDHECAGELAEQIEAWPCDGEFPEIRCDQYCKLHYGTRFEGQACNGSSDCGQGLICRNDECRDPCKLGVAREGESCDWAVCEEGLACVVVVDGEDGRGPATCERIDDGGQPCPETECSANEWCDFNDPMGPRCRGIVDVGGACSGHLQCTTSFCPAGFCKELPGDGEPCAAGECRDGAECLETEADPEGTCYAVAPICGALLFVPYLVLGYDAFPYQDYY